MADRLARPNALIVPDDWFEDHYRQASLYFFDPTGQHPGPRAGLRARATSSPTALVQALLAGPGPRLDDVSGSFFPPGLTPGLSVPVTTAGSPTIDPRRATPSGSTPRPPS